MDSPTFQVLAQDSSTAARRGRLRTLHGEVETPIFMPVGTQGTVKGCTPEQLRDIGTQILLGNTYHLNLRPGPERIQLLGGLHRFMGWDRPILTDSGGFQVFSLAKLRRITEEGIRFRSHLDGSPVWLTPEAVVRIQSCFGSDIAMVLDECPPYPSAAEDLRRAVDRTLRWAATCLQSAREEGFLARGHLLFGIVQGAQEPDLRRECALALAGMGFPGYAIGGVSVGEPEEEMLAQVASSAPHLPAGKPRYVMGVGTPPQLLQMIALGADMFDCVMPTREARHGLAYTPAGTINLRNARFRDDPQPLVEGLDNPVCRTFSRAYLRHLVMAREMLACTLLSLHNLHFFLDLMAQARSHLEGGDFGPWHRRWIARYEEGGA